MSEFQFYCSAIKTFSLATDRSFKKEFQFYCSAIKTKDSWIVLKQYFEFQFYCSAIKTILSHLECLQLLFISILL